jgi:hypothetical protein
MRKLLSGYSIGDSLDQSEFLRSGPSMACVGSDSAGSKGSSESLLRLEGAITGVWGRLVDSVVLVLV